MLKIKYKMISKPNFLNDSHNFFVVGTNIVYIIKINNSFDTERKLKKYFFKTFLHFISFLMSFFYNGQF